MLGLRRTSASTLVPNCVAIENSVSPGLTVHLTRWPPPPVVVAGVVSGSSSSAVVAGVVSAGVVSAVVARRRGWGRRRLGRCRLRRRRLGRRCGLRHRERLDRPGRGGRGRRVPVRLVPEHARAREDQRDHGHGSEQRGRREVHPGRALIAGALPPRPRGALGLGRALAHAPSATAQAASRRRAASAAASACQRPFSRDA